MISQRKRTYPSLATLRNSVILCLAGGLLSGALQASDLTAADPYDLNRAGRWADVVQYFKSKPPTRTTDRFILGRAHDQLVRDLGTGRGAVHLDGAFRYYLQAAGIRCRSTRGQEDIRQCIAREKAASRGGLIERLALLRAAELAEKFDYTSLPRRLQLLANLSPDDALSRKIYQNRLKRLLDANSPAAAKLALAYPKLDSPLINLYRARALAGKDDARARQFILSAGEATAVIWLQKAIYGEVKKNHGDLLSEANLSSRSLNNRRLVALARYMGSKELGALKGAFDGRYIVGSSTIKSVELDGMFLIRTGQARALIPLAQRHRNFLTMEPSILYDWVRMLKRQKEFGVMVALYRNFPAAKREHFAFWREYVRYLEGVDRDRYFKELLSFLNYFGANYHDNDRLIEFLIGDDTLHIKWADERYWKLAYKRLKPKTWNGRFMYWLRRYYLEHGNKAEAARLTDTFYQRAPGSYYATAFWSAKDSGDYVRDWNKVLNRQSYLWWISRHGGNLKAVHFISRKNLARYLDPQAVAFWNNLHRIQYRIPGPILDLHYLGETDLGKEFYDDEFDRKLPRKEHLARRAYIGTRTGNLYIQVYFTRELLRANLIPEDPFSLPAGLLARLYPRPYLSTVRKFATEYRIPSAMVYGLMRQESMFRETAISRSGARGLMQVMPATGSWLQDRMKLPRRNLLEPEVSIQLGSKYMSDMLRANDGDFRWASIAYNGGPGNLRKWKRKYYLDDFNLFLEKLPVAEPRNYCRITYQNYMHYRIAYLLYP